MKKPIRDPYLIVKDGQLAGMGAHSYSKGSATGGSEEAAKYKRNKLKTVPQYLPFLFNLILSAAGTLGSPGMVIIDPQTTTTNSAPLDNLTSLTYNV